MINLSLFFYHTKCFIEKFCLQRKTTVGTYGTTEEGNGFFVILLGIRVLWYILEELAQVFANTDNLLKNNGFLVFSNGFPREQKYGREIIDGFDGLVRYVCSKYFGKYRIVKAHVDYSGKFLFDDGILVLMKNG